MNPKKKVIVGLSGGVDSSVSAFLLKEQGYPVEGVYMKNWEEDDGGADCPAAEEIATVQAVCERLDIPFHTVNFSREYWDQVFEYFLAEYQAGRTPNPDVMCNQEIKFKAFLEYAQKLGADRIGMGHYVQTVQQGGAVQLLRGVDKNKDQSYFLYRLNQHQLAASLFPVGGMEKSNVRRLAKKLGLKNFDRKDSTGICFIGKRRFKNFLQQYLPAQPGNIETTEGKVIGQHDGLMYHTLGQRQGLNIGGRKDTSGKPWYVAQKDLKRNVLIVVQGDDHPLLFAKELAAVQPHWIAGSAPTMPLHCTAKIRYRQRDESCIITELKDDVCQVAFEHPQRAVTPGQSVVFYQGEVCLGGGVITWG